MQPSFKYTLENLETVSKFSQIKLLDDNNDSNNDKAVIEFRDPYGGKQWIRLKIWDLYFAQLMLLGFLMIEL